MKFAFRPKLLECLPTYNRAQFGKDLASGITVGVLALSLAMAFAIASGCSPAAGIWTAIVAGLLTSRTRNAKHSRSIYRPGNM